MPHDNPDTIVTQHFPLDEYDTKLATLQIPTQLQVCLVYTNVSMYVDIYFPPKNVHDNLTILYETLLALQHNYGLTTFVSDISCLYFKWCPTKHCKTLHGDILAMYVSEEPQIMCRPYEMFSFD